MIRSLTVLTSLLLIAGCGRSPTLLEEIKDANELIVVTRNSSTSYYEGPHGMTGLEYELVQRFADRLDVQPRFIVPANFTDILPKIINGEAHLAAAGLTVTEERKKYIRFGPSYQKITPQLVYRAGAQTPRNLNELNGTLEVVRGSSHVEHLHTLNGEYPDLRWTENDELGSEGLLYYVWEQVIDYTIADSNEVEINRRFYPELRVAFDISSPESLAWALAPGEDSSLYEEVQEFFNNIHADGTLDQLIERHYGYVQTFDYVGTRRYLTHVEDRLQQYLPLFKQAAEDTGLDWRLLAAVGYQESHWDPKAKSPTGVRGIMMLTLDTMRYLGLNNRLDPEQSIKGGGRYVRKMIDRIPDQVKEPDRTWLALAAYNVGYGHLDDARILTKKNGGNPDRWIDVRKNLPLLSQKKWHQQTRHGYARGHEPVRYVDNIRSYYDVLVWYTESKVLPTTEAPHFPNISPAL